MEGKRTIIFILPIIIALSKECGKRITNKLDTLNNILLSRFCTAPFLVPPRRTINRKQNLFAIIVCARHINNI